METDNDFKKNPNKFKKILDILKLEKPKKSCSAYVFFASEKRSQYSDKKFDEISKKLSEDWNSLPEEEKEYYEELSEYDKCRYKEQKRQYSRLFYQRLAKAIQNGTISPSDVEIKYLPKIKTRNSFAYFTRYMKPLLKVHGESDYNVIAKPLSIMWNALNAHQRTPFNMMSRDDAERSREERLLYREISLCSNESE